MSYLTPRPAGRSIRANEERADMHQSEASQAPASEPPPQTGGKPKVPPNLWRLLGWLLWGDLVLMLMEQVVPNLFPLMLKDHGASNKAIGLIMGTLPTCIGMFLGPIISYRSDHCRLAMGRRRPFIMFAIPFIVVFLSLFPFAPEITTYLLGVNWLLPLFQFLPGTPLLIVFAVLFLLYSIFNGICGSAYNWLFVDVVPLSHMGRFMSMLRIFSLLAVFAFNYFLMGLADHHLKEIFIGVALVYGAGFGVVSWKIREKALPPEPPKEKKGPWWGPVREFFATCFGKPFYRWVYLAFLIYGWSALAGSLFSVLFMRDTLGMDMDTLGKLRAWVTILVIPISYVFGSLIDRWKPQNVIVPAILAYAAGNLACFFFIQGKYSFFAWTFITNIAAFFWGVTYTAYTASILPKEKYGQLSTGMGLVTAILGAALMSPLCGKFFDLIHNNYRYMYLWQTVFLLVCAVIFWRLRAMWLRYGGPDNYQAP